MQAPEFWQHDGFCARLLTPLSWAVTAIGRQRWRRTDAEQVSVPVICVGNLVVGGAGKTPVVIALAHKCRALSMTPHFLTRGYGGNLPGPVLVDPERHGPADVGDEALLLAKVAPVWVSRDRPAGARAAVDAGAGMILMDDGFQNPSLHKDVSLIVVDPAYRFGNNRVMPAGPLREPVADGLARADAVIALGRGTPPTVGALPLIAGCVEPGENADKVRGQKVLAFAGIGRPEKFFETLRDLACTLVASQAFADHHPYQSAEIVNLIDRATALGAVPVTTEKDWVRLPLDLRDHVIALGITVKWHDDSVLDQLLNTLLSHNETAPLD